MTFRLSALPLLSLLPCLLLSPLLLAADPPPAGATEDEDGSGFEAPLSDSGEAGFAIAAMVANLKVCGASEQQQTVFYNREKQRTIADQPGVADVASQFDAGFTQGRNHMAVAHQRGYAMPDAAICKALWYRFNRP